MSLRNKIKTFFTLEDEYEYVEAEQQLQNSDNRSSQNQLGSKVVSLKSVTSQSKVILCEPRTYSEAQEIADHIVNRRSVIINLQRVDHAQAKQIIDFLSGTVYAIAGNIQKLGEHTFLCTPDNVDVSGSISELVIEE
ncbi:cell division protein SepF [Aquibacillus sp. 3ASR75-11]|uniref:Cell division protein SepF n=1 Tax=Terrihalobacillus insolitus TaxID=2950438 RepID=A0A9X3WPS9_9BACI|nr:cell division protein SepF [Terrihalobacillus insolitus]MDC3412847.1 cell division protein SepF [Terrihalobacillus insolitus]MDC3423677.1 cell division protein SepF [Terrihalobacillus insolitus]